MKRKAYEYLAIGLLAMVIFSGTLSSFSLPPGGDHFEIYLNKKLVFQQLVSHTGGVKSFAIDQQNINDQVDIFYSHCGQPGSKRRIVIQDGKNALKQWRFSDAGSRKFMSVKVREMLSFEANSARRRLNLVYLSDQLPEGRILASVIIGKESDKVMR